MEIRTRPFRQTENAIEENAAIEHGLREKAAEYRRAGAGGIDERKANPKGAADGQQPNQFAHSGTELYASSTTMEPTGMRRHSRASLRRNR
jgi:hypothetical protein